MNITSKTNTSAEPSSAKEPETTTTVTENRGLFCKKCGKAVEIDAVYCKYCGAKLEGISFFRIAGGIMPLKEALKKLKCLLKWVMVAGACILGGFSYMLIWDEFGYHIYEWGPLWDMRGWIYILPPFVGYCIYRILCNYYSLDKNFKALLRISLTLIVTAFIAGQTWYAVERQIEHQIQEYERYKINRTFLNCTFGDSMLEVQKKLEASNRDYEFYNGSFGKSIRMTNVSYGAYKIDTLCFNFHDNSFFQAYMKFSDLTEKDINNDLTYYDLQDMLNEKYKGANPFYDNQTEITLDRYFEKDDYDRKYNYCVVLVYYDKQTQDAVDYEKITAKQQGF